MPISSCDENRLRLAQEAESKFAQARQLVKSGDFAGALECYLFAFDNSLAVSGWGGVRLSYIPSEIAQLGNKYPPAKEALQVRRNAREEMIRAGETDFNLVSEWTSLNGYLCENDRELALLEEMEKRGNLDESVKDRIIDSNFDRLLSEKRYDILSGYLDDFGNQFMMQIFHYEEAALFPERFERAPGGDYWKSHIRDSGAKVFELALGVRKELQADGIATRILLYCTDAETYNKLINAALRAGHKKKARELAKHAKANLDREEYDKVKKF